MVESTDPDESEIGSESLTNSLLFRLQRNDRSAWHAIEPSIRATAKRTLRRRGIAEQEFGDLTQNVLMRAFTGIGEFDKKSPGATFLGWIHRIADNVANDFYRARPIPNQELLSDLPSPDCASEPAEEWKTLALSVLEFIRDDFQPRTFQCFLRYHLDLRTTKEVAAELEMSEQAAREARLRVERRWRAECREMGFEPDAMDP